MKNWALNFSLGCTALFLLIGALVFGEEPAALYLSWTQDPTTTMIIQWHTTKAAKASTVFYQRNDETIWHQQEGDSQTLSLSSLLIHTVDLQGLDPATVYRFKLEERGKTYLFRTMPKGPGSKIRFIVAGDAYFYLYLFKKMNQQIASENPDFVVIGGDIAYTKNHASPFKGKMWESKRWETFFSEWKNQMVAPDGRLIPMLVVVGNHDVKTYTGNPKEKPQLFYELFAFPEDSIPYRSLDFNKYLSLVMLDSGHTYPINGKQTDWLENTLKEKEDFPYKFAIYHVSAYPSVYDYNGKTPAKIRKNWCPLFERYGVKAAFEHHNHAYKMTEKIKEEKIDPDGVLYLGDGTWGVPPRKVKNAKSWYIANSASVNSYWLVDLQDDKCMIRSKDIDGKLIDEVEVSPLLLLTEK